MDQAIWLLDTLCEENQDDIFRRRSDVAIMHDGTELIAISLSVPQNLYGLQFDYVFYEKNLLTRYCADYAAAMEYLEQRCLVRSMVPREFQWSAVD
jgi:hypothetical protein